MARKPLGGHPAKQPRAAHTKGEPTIHQGPPQPAVDLTVVDTGQTERLGAARGRVAEHVRHTVPAVAEVGKAVRVPAGGQASQLLEVRVLRPQFPEDGGAPGQHLQEVLPRVAGFTRSGEAKSPASPATTLLSP
ncbi:hypothetical protein [Streptomyces sp. AP-93]|uniref:hypothetical protein n=1 Tax=Streptomyces sp. AP-93 TaxID=2929048 RepID=UPI0035AEC712